ncbi:pseudouridine-5-phosphate glycosidase [Candidatus Izimaplasma bacterium ZiA1]|uniref:pseudouridine-5'-phosphate glycosidase n=1 Tax=Candidatus Izimoplasma sp. ZiA1 TaxID=2024899 RepID=UPI000BAA3927|nr:pseudouridine-5-phosphate glycosidase [Candidatus Izimaplasma bacterium ZiA1]
MKNYLEISDKVKNALEKNLPIVALESTIISHGMPFPKNVETALNCEKIIEENGAVPATIALINGKLKVGLTVEEITYLGKKGLEVHKTSRRDIAYNIANKIDGATTVAATMFVAALAGIKVFATGGIGGVHRGATETFDISADLEELAETNVIVVSAGAKSILDLGLTMEYLETKGVEVVGYQTDILPAFYSRESDFKVNFNIGTPKGIADVFKTKLELNMRGGMMVANPIPVEYSMDKAVIDQAINEAIIEMDKLGIKGKNTTPYLLSKIKDITKGKSLESNIKLVYNNCLLAANISKYL